MSARGAGSSVAYPIRQRAEPSTLKSMGGRLMVGPAAVVTALLVATAALPATAKAPSRFRADLTAANEVPAPSHVPKPAGGRFIGLLTGRTLEWTLRYHSLSTSVTEADLALGVQGQAGPVVLRLCGPCTTPVSGRVKLTSTEVAQLNGKKLYVNVRTSRNANGEVRGQALKR